MKRIIALLVALLTALGLAGVASPAQAARAATGPTFTLVTSEPLDPFTQHTIDLWSSRTGISFVEDNYCSGPRCINAVVEEPNCGTAGCANPQADGSCLVQVETNLVATWSTAVVENTLAHEVGHCIIWNLGGDVSWHATNERDLMWYGIRSGDGLKPLTHETRAYLKRLLG